MSFREFRENSCDRNGVLYSVVRSEVWNYAQLYVDGVPVVRGDNDRFCEMKDARAEAQRLSLDSVACGGVLEWKAA